MNEIGNTYDSIAKHYDILYAAADASDEARRFLDSIAPILGALPPGARILDASCGHGVQAVALAQREFAVTATDASEEMVRMTEERARAEGVRLTATAAATWKELPSTFPTERFDLVLCWGNSICHCADRDERRATLGVFASLLRAGGTLIVHSRDWERLLAERPRYNVLGGVRESGKTCIPIYLWNWDELERPNSLTLVFGFLDDDLKVETTDITFSFTPFTKDALTEDIGSAGFREVDETEEWGGTYFLTTRKA